MDSLALFLKVNYGVSMIAVNHLNESTFFETNQRFFNTHIKSKDTSFPGAEEFVTKSIKHFCMRTHCTFKTVLYPTIVLCPIQLSVRINALVPKHPKKPVNHFPHFSTIQLPIRHFFNADEIFPGRKIKLRIDAFKLLKFSCIIFLLGNPTPYAFTSYRIFV